MNHPIPQLRLLAIVAAVCGATLAAAPAAQAAQACPASNATPAKASKPEIVRATLCELNSERARHGLRRVSLNRRLSRAARRHARDMARRNYFSHDSLGGGSFIDRIRREGYLRNARSWVVGENLAWGSHGHSRPRVIMQMWMNSPGHRANILNASFREIGIGVAYDAPIAGGGKPAGTYVTDFGSRG
ncbi:MAG: hypothetical protein QOH58_2351 [Thermoleophilaceae bacterium]|jgi:uncharacterized protein YkwD|nr:hypothetical protein [Thermoleophilaceae bacterium]